VTLTLGVSLVRSDDTIQQLTKRADLALYQGKSRGRNRVILSDDENRSGLPG
jgi:PleD family two-component response regulator